MLVQFATTTEGRTYKPFQMDESQSYYEKLKRKKSVRIVLIKPNTTSSPLDEVVYTPQPLAFCLATEKPQMMVQLATPWIFRDNMSIPDTRNPTPAVLLGLEFHEPCGDGAHAWSGRIWTCWVFLAASSAQSTRERERE